MAAGSRRDHRAMVPDPLHPDAAARNNPADRNRCGGRSVPDHRIQPGRRVFRCCQMDGRCGPVAIGSDSNIRVCLSEELRTLKYSQRLRDRSRAALATRQHSTGRRLFDAACRGGAQAAGHNTGRIAEAALAGLLALDAGHIDLADRMTTRCWMPGFSRATTGWCAMSGRPTVTWCRRAAMWRAMSGPAVQQLAGHSGRGAAPHPRPRLAARQRHPQRG